AVRASISLPATAPRAGRAVSPGQRRGTAAQADEPPCQEELPVGL
ncbi:MAG: hypothetical protein AVDCRST_MAG57-506, partial [uncultured Blastococcus sp.]